MTVATPESPPRSKPIEIIDGFLRMTAHRKLISSDEVADFCLDLRNALPKETS